jgi:predicted deacetylase
VNADRPALLVALHDVTPAHAARLARAERLLSELGIPSVAYFFVPDFHGRAPAHDDRAFAGWCRAPRPYRVQWFLHGYSHQESPGDRRAAPSTLVERFARTFLTNGEAEFLPLRGERLHERLEAGIVSHVYTVGSAPEGFVAPAWLFNDELMAALKRLALRFTESHFHVFDVGTGQAVAAPVITWASRSAVHRAGARAAAAAERRLWRSKPILRIGLHPADFDHPSIVDSVARTLEALCRTRQVIGYGELGFAPTLRSSSPSNPGTAPA